MFHNAEVEMSRTKCLLRISMFCPYFATFAMSKCVPYEVWVGSRRYCAVPVLSLYDSQNAL